MREIVFGEPRVLWLLTGTAALIVLWLLQAALRLASRRGLARRVLPHRQRFRHLGELTFWLAMVVASGAFVVAAARPASPVALPLRPGLDLVVLQDGSASMRVGDVARVASERRIDDRWQRSMTFLRELGNALSWNDDRLAMVAFANIASPQIRLTRDPNTLFFFLDHLYARPPFRVEDDTTWDTNLEEAVSWGLRVVDKDQEIHGRSDNGAVFLMLSDGEAWSGEVAKAVTRVAARGIPLYVIGVGTLGGAMLPVVRTPSGELLESPGLSRLERASLQRIASSGRGRYFELDRDTDTFIANTIVAEGRRLAPAVGVEESAQDLYWWFLVAGAAVALSGCLAITQRVPLAILLAGSVLSAVLLSALLFRSAN